MWNERAGHVGQCDWTRVAAEFCKEASRVLSQASLGAASLEETRIYAGYEAGRENKLKGFLHNFLDRQPGIRVFTSERHWKARAVHCRNCNNEHQKCPTCDAVLGRAAEKTVDAKIVTDLIGLAWEGAYDAAILVTADKDFIPAVDHLQSKNYKIINASWRGHGHELAAVCWASFGIDPLIPSLIRK